MGLWAVMQDKKFLLKDRIQRLIDVLADAGYRVLGPQVSQGAIVFAELGNADQLPFNVSQQQSPGHYCLQQDRHGHYFAWANGPQALKPLTFAPKEPLWSVARHSSDSLDFRETLPDVKPTAVIGVRACDLAAMRLQEQHFLESEYADGYFAARRSKLFLVAVNCTHPAQTCFCTATGDGPAADAGYDLVFTELEAGFVMAAGSSQGQKILEKLPTSLCETAHFEQEAQQLAEAARRQTRKLPKANLAEVLPARRDDAYWEEMAKRCLACGNCTAVCPTCFCHSETDQSSLDNRTTTHYRLWDSCFNQEHSYIHGIVIRASVGSKYRQWLSHKFGYWVGQYGRSGCVGCGRCISWCPVGIDVTEELEKITRLS